MKERIGRGRNKRREEGGIGREGNRRIEEERVKAIGGRRRGVIKWEETLNKITNLGTIRVQPHDLTHYYLKNL